MSDQEIVVTDSDHSVAAREPQKETPPVAEKPKPEKEQDAPKKVEAPEAADDADDSDDTQNETGGSADPGNDEPSKPKNRGVGKRIDELTKARYDAERERDHWRDMAMRQNPSKKEPDAPAAVPDDDPEPTLESCDFDDSRRMREWYEWRRRQDKKVETKQAQSQKFAEREAAFRAEHSDYDAVARNPAVPITQQVAEIILETDDPPAIAYYLGQNITEAAAIAQMTPHQMGRAIGRIEAKLSAPTAAPAVPRQPEPKNVTRAPPPVTTLTGGAPAVRKSYDDMSQEEYEQVRREERRAQGLTP